MVIRDGGGSVIAVATHQTVVFVDLHPSRRSRSKLGIQVAKVRKWFWWVTQKGALTTSSSSTFSGDDIITRIIKDFDQENEKFDAQLLKM